MAAALCCRRASEAMGQTLFYASMGKATDVGQLVRAEDRHLIDVSRLGDLHAQRLLCYLPRHIPIVSVSFTCILRFAIRLRP